METIRTIDLWTEQYENHYECFNGAFVDGFENHKIPFDKYKIIKNCNCVITVSLNGIHISNKHNAIIFYKDKIPVRLMVINKNTDVLKCMDVALNQYFEDSILKDYYNKQNIDFSIVDMQEEPIFKEVDDITKETDIGSCDRWKLLYSMLKGSYTESDTAYGNFQSEAIQKVILLMVTFKVINMSLYLIVL